jgi:hypothetical protein
MSATSQQRRPNPAHDPQKIKLMGVTIAYAESVTTARAFAAGQEPKFSGSFIAWGPKAADMSAAVDAASRAAAADKWGRDAKNWPRLRGINKEPLVKAVADYPTMMADPPAGAVFVRASSNEAPGFVDAQNVPLTATEARAMLYSGWVVNVALRAFAYDQIGGQGIGLGLHNLQLVRPGKRLGPGRQAAQSEFGPVADEDLEGDDEEYPA